MVGISGTGGGFKKFCRGETDISDASRPISVTEMKACAEAGIAFSSTVEPAWVLGDASRIEQVIWAPVVDLEVRP